MKIWKTEAGYLEAFLNENTGRFDIFFRGYGMREIYDAEILIDDMFNTNKVLRQWLESAYEESND